MEFFFLWLFHDKKPIGKFILNPTIQLIGFFALKKIVNKDAKSTCVKEGTKHMKCKEIESLKLQKKLKKFVVIIKIFLKKFEA
jgi:hypothetical protein